MLRTEPLSANSFDELSVYNMREIEVQSREMFCHGIKSLARFPCDTISGHDDKKFLFSLINNIPLTNKARKKKDCHQVILRNHESSSTLCFFLFTFARSGEYEYKVIKWVGVEKASTINFNFEGNFLN